MKEKASKLFRICFIAVIMIALIDLIYNPIVKVALTEDQLEGTYILCQRQQVTGFDWKLVTTNELGKKGELCNIVGADPFEELALSYEFFLGENTFVFYVEERRDYYSEETKQNVVEFIVTGWDILYPVNREAFLSDFKSHKYILGSDCAPFSLRFSRE